MEEKKKENVTRLGLNTYDLEPNLPLIRCAMVVRSFKPPVPDLLFMTWE